MKCSNCCASRARHSRTLPTTLKWALLLPHCVKGISGEKSKKYSVILQSGFFSILKLVFVNWGFPRLPSGYFLEPRNAENYCTKQPLWWKDWTAGPSHWRTLLGALDLSLGRRANETASEPSVQSSLGLRQALVPAVGSDLGREGGLCRSVFFQQVRSGSAASEQVSQ